MMLTKLEFDSLPPYPKGYAVYMLGARKDEPNVPRRYKPNEDEREEFDRGERQAVLDAQDSEE